jgi:hypothetical protein
VKFPTTIGLLSSRSAKKGSSARSRASSSAKRRLASGLSQDELLAKIDSLDWDQTVSPNTVVAGSSQAVAAADEHGSSNAWQLAAIVAGVVCVAAIAYYLLVPADLPEQQRDVHVSGPITASTEQAVETPAMSQRAIKESLAAVAASEERRAERYEQAVQAAEIEAQRKVERARQAREARQAARAKVAAQKERERLQQEEAARMRVQREAEEAAKLAAARAREQAAPKGPASPQEACAGEGNFLARGLCESRLCGRPEWRSHPQCVKRFDDQLRALGSGN